MVKNLFSKEKLTPRNLLLFSFVLIVLALIFFSLFKPISQDEGVFLTIGRGITSGKIPYLDFFDHKPPGIYYLFAALFPLFGKNILFYRIFLWTINIISAFLIAKIAQKYLEKEGIIAGLIYLYLLLYFEGNYLIAEPFVAFFTLLSLWVLLSEKRWKYFWSGASIAMAILFKQTAIIGLAILVTYIFVKEKSLKKVGQFLLPIAMSVIFLIMWMWQKGALAEAYNQIIVLNLTSYPVARVSDFFAGIKDSFTRTWWIWIAAIFGILKYGKDKKLLLAFLLLPIPPFLVRGYPHYWIQILPFAAIFSAIGFFEISKFKPQLIAYFLLLIAIISVYQNFLWSKWIYADNLKKIETERQVAQKISDSKSEYLLAENQFVGFYFLTDKKPLTKYLYLTEINSGENAEGKTIEALKNHPDTTIIWPSDPNFAYAKKLQAYILYSKNLNLIEQ